MVIGCFVLWLWPMRIWNAVSWRRRRQSASAGLDALSSFFDNKIDVGMLSFDTLTAVMLSRCVLK